MLDLVPAPIQAVPAPGHLVLDHQSTLFGDATCEGATRWLRATLSMATGLPLAAADEPTATVCFRAATTSPAEQQLSAEGFRLEITEDRADVVAADPAGAFYAAQALRQLLGPDAFRAAPAATSARTTTWTIPCGAVLDAPRFRWRGVLLDVARHFLPKASLLRFIDLAAAHRINRLHLHLTDDQGWRIEIAAYPRLTEVGAWRRESRVGAGQTAGRDGRPHGGYYTQADLREIVAFAAERHVTVVPEIDLPGHSQAAIAAYPELGNVDGPLPVLTDWGINHNVLNVEKATVGFFSTVLDEVVDLFPSPWIHLGGDEVPTDQLATDDRARSRLSELGLESVDELPAWFVGRLAVHLRGHGRIAGVWDEIADTALPNTALPDEALVFAWRSSEAGLAAARAGHDVVMCPEQEVYLDHRQSDRDDEPIPVGYVRTWEDLYAFDPLPVDAVPPGARSLVESRVLGAQANLWTEHLDSPRRLDYAAFPRLAAFAEAMWTVPSAGSLEGFRARLTGAHLQRLDALGVEYRPLDGPRPWQTRPGVPGRALRNSAAGGLGAGCSSRDRIARSGRVTAELDSSLYVFVEDLREGVDVVLDRAIDDYHVGGLTVGAAYHQSRDLTPHGPSRLTLRRDGVHLLPPQDLFDGLRLQPPLQAGAHEEPLREVVAAAARRGAPVHAWTVLCHNSTLGDAHPDCTLQTCFGDRASPGDLCPSAPDVRDYAVALAQTVARTGAGSVVAKALSFGGLGHGYHHERSFLGLTTMDSFLLGLCFCEHCLLRASTAGVDADAVRRRVVDTLVPVLDGTAHGPQEVTRETLAEFAGEAVLGYVLQRCETVTSLVARIAASVREEGSTLVFLDPAGAAKGYADGTPTGLPAATDAWLAGVDPAAVAAVVDGYAVLAYASSPERVDLDVRAYRDVVGPDLPLRATLRPMPPDTTSAAQLTERTVAARRAGASAVDFYAYGLASFEALRGIPIAMRAARSAA